LQIGEKRLQRGAGEQPLGQVLRVVSARRGQMVGHRRFQGDAAHRKSRGTGQADQSGRVGGVQFLGRGHAGHLLSDKSVLATARVARPRGFLLVRGEDSRRHLQMLGVLRGQDGFQSQPRHKLEQTIRGHQRGKPTRKCFERCRNVRTLHV